MTALPIPVEQHWASLTASALAAVVVGFASTILVIMQAADAVGASAAQKASWAAVLCFAMGGLTLLLSWRHKMPVVIAWSTPGAALLATSAGGISYPVALGTFAFAGMLTVATGLARPVARAIEQIPPAIAAAMLAGVLLNYVLKVPLAIVTLPWLVAPLVLLFFGLRLWQPIYAVPVVVAAGFGIAAVSGNMGQGELTFGLPKLTFDVPQFQWQAVFSLGVPLFLVTMASQNLPGFAVLRASGYQPPVTSALVATGLASALMSPMAGPQVNMAAITASLCTGPDAHPDPAQRWKISIPYVVLYVLVGVAAPAFVTLLGGLPHDLVLSIAGLALFGPLVAAIAGMMKDAKEMDSAMVTFMVTASGVSLFGIGAAFWGLASGLILWGIKRLRKGVR